MTFRSTAPGPSNPWKVRGGVTTTFWKDTYRAGEDPPLGGPVGLPGGREVLSTDSGPLGSPGLSAGCSTDRKKGEWPLLLGTHHQGSCISQGEEDLAAETCREGPRQLSPCGSRVRAWRSLSGVFSSPRCPWLLPHFLVVLVASPMSEVLEKRPHREGFGGVKNRHAGQPERRGWDGNAGIPGGPPTRDPELCAFSSIIKTNHLSTEDI